MKAMNLRKITVLLVMAILGLVLTGQAVAQDNYALLLQSSPPDAGTIAPGLGVHEIQVGQTIGLSATPKPGYRFAYWLGDVSSASALETSISIDSPKLVVAVFVREEYEEKLPGTGVMKGQPNSSGQRGVPNPVTTPRSPSPGYDYNPKFNTNLITIDPNVDETEETDVLVPETVPEPATILLLGMGGLLLRRKRQ